MYTPRVNSDFNANTKDSHGAKLRSFSNVMLVLTEGCNLRCSYCYEQEKPYSLKNKMSFETAKKAIDLLFRQVPDKMNRTSISFFGGEPTLEFDLIKKVIAYSFPHRTIGGYGGKQYNYVINTNGTILTEEMFQLYGKLGKRLNLRISVDGYKEQHDMNRKTVEGKGSWHLVEKNLTYFRKLKEKYGVNAYMISTINKATFRNIYHNFTRLYELTGMQIGSLFVHENKWEKEDFETITEQLILLHEYCLQRKIMFPLCRTQSSPNLNHQSKEDFNSICGAGVNSFTVNHAGDIYACHRANYHSFGESFKLGDINNGLDIEKVAMMYELNNLKRMPLKCQECLPSIREKCHLCLASNKEAYGDFHTVSEDYCLHKKKLHHQLVERKQSFMKQQNDKKMLAGANKKLSLQTTPKKNITLTNRPFTDLLLILTEGCNLRCSYCYEQGKPYSLKNKMSFETAKKAIDLFFRQVPDKMSRTSINFFGGEPTLEFDLIKKVIAYSFPHRTIKGYAGKQYNYVINTNGTVLTEEMFQLYGKLGKRLNLRISVDGYKEQHDITRKTSEGKGSWHLIEKNLKYFRKLKDAYGVNVNLISTINKATCKNIFHNYTNLHKLTGMQIAFLFIHEDKWEKEDFESIKEQVLLLHDYCLKNNVMFPLCNAQTKPNSNNQINNNLFQSICTAGISTFTVNYAGDIYACHRAYYYGADDLYKIGDVENGLNSARLRRIYEFNNFKMLPLKCQECAPKLRDKCHVCFATNKKTYGDFYTVSDEYCSLMKELQNVIAERERNMILPDNKSVSNKTEVSKE